MLVDPYGNKMQANPLLQQAIDLGQPAQQSSYIVEVCDPIEDAQYGYQINGVLLSDFPDPALLRPGRRPRRPVRLHARHHRAPPESSPTATSPGSIQDGNAWQLMNFLGPDGTPQPTLRDLSQNAIFQRVLQAEALRPAVDRVMQLTSRPDLQDGLTDIQLQAFQERTRVVSYAAQAHAERLNTEIAPIAGALAAQKPADTTSDIVQDPYAAILIESQLPGRRRSKGDRQLRRHRAGRGPNSPSGPPCPGRVAPRPPFCRIPSAPSFPRATSS